MFAGQQHLSQFKEQLFVFLTELDISHCLTGFFTGVAYLISMVGSQDRILRISSPYYFHFLFVYFKCKHNCTHQFEYVSKERLFLKQPDLDSFAQSFL